MRGVLHQKLASAADLPDDAELLRLDFAGADDKTQVVRIIAAEGGSFGGGDPVVGHCDMPISVVCVQF